MQKQSVTTTHQQTHAHLGNQVPTSHPLLPLPQFLLLSMTLCGME